MNVTNLNRNATVVIHPPQKKVWDHDDGSFQRSSLPGIMVWRSSDGEITLKCDINGEIANGKYCSITAILMPENAQPIVIPQTSHKIILEPQKRYQLLLIAIAVIDHHIDQEQFFLGFYSEG